MNTIARRGGVATIGAIAAALGGFLLTAIVGRGLGPNGSGLFFTSVAVFTVASSIAMLGADTTLLRSLSQALALGRLRDVRRTLAVGLIPVAVLALVITVALVVNVPAVAHLVIHGTSTTNPDHYFYLLLPFLVIGTLTTVVAQATRAFGGVLPFVVVQNLLLPLGRPLAVLVIVLAGWSVLAIPLVWGALFVPALVVAAVSLRRQLRRRDKQVTTDTPAPRRTRDIAIEFWRYSSVRGLAAAVESSLVWFDVILVSIIRTAAEAGVYATGSRFITSGTLVMQAMRIAIAPQISALMSTGQRERAGEIYRVATIWVIASSWPLYLALALFSPMILRLFGDDFSSGSTAVTILAISMLANLGTGNVGTVLLMAGRSSWLLIDKVAALTVNVSLNLLLVPTYGITGAAIAWGAAIGVDNLMAVIQVHRGLGLHGYERASALVAAFALICFGAFGLLVRFTMGVNALALTTYLLVAGVTYGILLWRFRSRIHLQELGDVVRIPGLRRSGPAAGPSSTPPRPARARRSLASRGRHRR